MNRKVMSLLTALLLCLNFSTVWAFAAEGTPDAGAPPVVDTGTPPAPDQAAPKKTARTAERSSDINMQYGGFVFAQGVPIVIRENGAITSIYDVNGNLLSGDVDVSGCSVYGGWYDVDDTEHSEDTSIVMESGTVKEIFGGSFKGTLTGSTHVVLKGGTVKYVYGGSNQGTVEKAIIELGPDWDFLSRIYAGSYGNTTNSAEVILHNYATTSSSFITLVASNVQDATVFVRRDDGGPLNKPNPSSINLILYNNWNAVVEYGTVTFLGMSGSNLPLTLDSLEIQASGKVKFQDWGTVTIKKLSGNGGQLLFPAQFLSGTSDIVNKPVVVEEIDAATSLIIKAEGNGWRDEVLEKFFFLHGSGIDALTSTDCFFSEGFTVVLREISDKSDAKGIYLQSQKAQESVYISRMSFRQNPVVYNGTLPLTVGVAKSVTTIDKLETIPGARIQIRGSDAQQVLLADILINDQGTAATITDRKGETKTVEFVRGDYITFDLPVDAALLDTCKEGLYMLATAPGQYSSRAQLIGPNGETEIKITPAQITLDNTIPDPGFQDPLQSGFEEGPFYTASVKWHPADDTTASAFQPNRDYQADIVLTPKAGHWLCKESIGETVNYGGKAVQCVFHTDGTVTLKDQKRVRFDGHPVTVTASPAQGGTVTGGGVYVSGGQATIQAVPNDGWEFVGWLKDGDLVADTPEHTVTVNGPLNFTAQFEQTRYEVTVTASPAQGGTVTGGGVYVSGGQATIQAVPNDGWEFVGWLKDGDLVADTPEHTVTVNGPLNFTAQFEQTRYEVTVTASPTQGGTVTGGGTYLHNSQATIKAEPAQGWKFTGWTEGGKEIANTIEYHFPVTGPRNITAVFEKEPERSETKLEIRDGISEVPPAFKDLEHLNTPEKITLAMRAAITQTGIPTQNTAVYDVTLMVSTDGGKTWVPATKDNFPAGGLTVTLPYPAGTDSSYTFTVVHMFTTGDFDRTPGDTERPPVTNTASGIQFTVNGLSPISVGWVKPDGPSGGGGTSGGGGSHDRNDEYDFWQGVRQKIEAAKAGDTVRANAGSYDKMPWTVMEALKKSNHITLVIRWSGGADIVIPSEKALDEALRIYYPLAYLAGYDFGIITDPSKQNPETGGIWEIDAPITAQAPLTSAGTPEITDARRGLAETPELAEQGVEKAIPGVYEPTANATPAESPVQSGERGSFSVAAVFLLAALLGLIWVWRKKGNESHGESVQNSQ